MSNDWELPEGVTVVVEGSVLTGASMAADLRVELLDTTVPDWAETLGRNDLGFVAQMLAMIVAGLADVSVFLCQTKKFEVATRILADQAEVAQPPDADEDGEGPSAEAVALLGQLEIVDTNVLELTGPRCKVRMELKGPYTDLLDLSEHASRHLHWLVCLYAWLLMTALDNPDIVGVLPVMVEAGLTLLQEATTMLAMFESGVVMVTVPMDAFGDNEFGPDDVEAVVDPLSADQPRWF